MASPEHVRHTWSDADTLAARDTQTERNRLAREVREGRWDHRFPTLHK